jgi:uncharacterized protein YbbK (DUF523 family)
MASEHDSTPVLVSACLIGRYCRYDGRTNLDRVLEREPRPAAWIERESAAAVLDGRDRVVSADGRDVTAEFVRGAQGALELCRQHGVRRAYLKARSPSCGNCQTHVAGELVAGPGVTAELLKRAGIEVVDVEGKREG